MNQSYHYYCPFCGTSNFPTNTRCCHCKREMSLVQSINDFEYYRTKSMKIYGDFLHWNDILVDEEASKNPLFDQAARDYKESDEELTARIKDIIAKNQPPKPKCPTCGSENVQKISELRKAGGAMMFGLFSKTARSQFECKNCGYKWRQFVVICSYHPPYLRIKLCERIR